MAFMAVQKELPPQSTTMALSSWIAGDLRSLISKRERRPPEEAVAFVYAHRLSLRSKNPNSCAAAFLQIWAGIVSCAQSRLQK